MLVCHVQACMHTRVHVPFNLALIDERGLMTELLTILQSYFIIAMSVRLNQNMQLTGTPGTPKSEKLSNQTSISCHCQFDQIFVLLREHGAEETLSGGDIRLIEPWAEEMSD